MSDRKVVLVTGCRSGFGLLAAVTAARAGYTVYAGLRDLSTAGDLEAASRGLAVIPVQLDVTEADQRAQVVDRIVAERGRIDGLVNNAGRALGGFAEQIDEDELRALFDLNLFAVFSLTNLVLPTMRAQRSGVVVNLSSMSGRMGLPGLSAYAASKFALEGYSEALRHELRPFGVRVTLLEPAAYSTDIFGRNKTLARRAEDEGPYLPYARSLEAFVDEKVTPRAGDPQDVADRIVSVLDGRHRGLRYPMGPGSRMRLLAWSTLPFTMIEAMIGRMLRP